MTQEKAALKAGMTRKTARRHLAKRMLPSELAAEPRAYRTREDAFDGVWPAVEALLDADAKLEAKTLFDWLQREHPERFADGQLRTLQRRMKVWRATKGPAKEVFFAQVHHPGKSHAVCAIAQELVRRSGGHRKVYFRPCSLMIQDLLVAKRDLKLTRLLKRLAGFDVLVLDDLGYVQHDREEMEVLFTLLAERYERGSIMITSNLPFSKWDGIFKDAMTTAAAIDRLVHHSVILEMNVGSYRLEKAGQATRKEAATEA
jgi:chromosomal replication initiation ATPase DnaA